MIAKKTTGTSPWPRYVAACLALVTAVPLAGCSGYSQASHVDAPRAREALKIALEHWKSGGDASSLQSSSTPMVAQDFDWSSGAKLLDYQIIDDGKEEDANLRVQVKLKLSPPGKEKAKPVEKTASYVVNTSPSVSVYRDIMRR